MFADLVRADGNLRVADLGCGPGRVSDYLASLGLDTVGVDLSPRMIEIARRSYPSLRFEVGSVTALDLPDGQLGGVIAWFSIFHTPADELPTVFGEFHRVLAPGGQLLVATHSGDGLEAPEQAYGHPVSYELHLLPLPRLSALLAAAGFTLTAEMHQPYPAKPGRSVSILVAQKD